MTTAETNKARLRLALAAYSEGDIAPLREIVEPGVVYHSHAPRALFRAGGRHEGFAHAIAAMSSMASDYAIHSYQVRDLTADGDIVWSLAEIDATFRRRKKRFKISLAARWEFRGGRVATVDEFYDTGSAALNQGLVTIVPSGK